MVLKKFNENYHIVSEWRAMNRFTKWYTWFLFMSTYKDPVAKKRYFTLVLFGLLVQLATPYKHKFSYKNMPKIKGRRKV